MSVQVGHVESKIRSLGQMLEKPYVRSRGHIFSPIIMNHDQISDKFENGLCWVKN